MTNPGHRTLYGRTVALAALYQAVGLVQQTAYGRTRDALATTCSINSIFVTSPGSIEEVFGGMAGLAPGLDTLCEQFGNDSSKRDPGLTGYAITLLHLERRLSRQPALQQEVARGIEASRAMRGEDQVIPPELTAALAAVYTRTISTIAPRIRVQGEPAILKAEESRNMIRALLLAGMRAAVLWRHCGGNRIRLLLERSALHDEARRLRREAGYRH